MYTDKLPPFMRLISLFCYAWCHGIRRAYYISKYMDEYTRRLFNGARWISFNVDPWKAFLIQALAQVHSTLLLRPMPGLSLPLSLDLNY